jgi:signal transduction histidine kinase
LFVVLAVTGLVATAATVAVTAQSRTLADPLPGALMRGFDVASWTAVGMITLHRMPDGRLARLMLAVAAALAATTLMALSDPTAFALGRLARAAVPILVLATFLSFPSGRIEELSSRWLIRVAAVATAVVWVALMVCGDAVPLGGVLGRCAGPCPAAPIRLISLGAVEPFLEVLTRVSAATIGLAVAAVMALRLRRASPASRRTLVLPLGSVIAAAVLLAAATALDELHSASAHAHVLSWLGVFCVATFPYAFLLGQERGRLFGATALHRAVLELAPHRQRRDVRDVLAEALGDPALELCYWVPTLNGYVDRVGQPVYLDRVAPRSATSIGVDGVLVAAILHDPALDASPGLVEAAGNAALLALENGRLEAELRSSIEELRASRARLVSVGIDERRRLERDLHDTAQNQLVALRIRLGLAEERAREVDAELAAALAALAEEAQGALDGIRRIARGIYPPLLITSGVVDALHIELARAAVPVHVVGQEVGRSSPQAEVAVYFVCWEAVQNAAKHAGPGANVTVRLRRQGQDLAFSVFDDGRGFDPRQSPEGFGRAAMRDRIGALGGSLELHSAPGHGVLVTGRLRWPPRATGA